MKKLLFIAILIIMANVSQAQVNGFSLTDPMPSNHNLGDSFPLNISFNWIPTVTTSAIVTIDYNPAMVGYDPSCANSLPECINIADNGSQLTITLSDLSACTNTSSISFNVCFQFVCPDTCTGVVKTAQFDALITDNIPTTQTASCTSNGILNNNVTLNHSFYSYNVMTAEITFRACFNNTACFIINNPSFDIAISPLLGVITSVYGTNYTYTITTNGVAPDVTQFNPGAFDCFYYVLSLDSCNTGADETLISNVTFKGNNCGIPNSTIKGPEQASFLIPLNPVANTNVAVSASSSATSFSYNITNTGNTPLDLTATNFLPLVHLKTSPTSVMQTTTQPLLDGNIYYYDCTLLPTGPFPLPGNGAADANAPGETKKFDHQVNNLLPGKSVSLTLYYDLSSSCNGSAGDPPFKDSVSIVFQCNSGGGGGPTGGCVPCGEGGVTHIEVTYNPLPNINCWTTQYFEGCKNVGDTLDFCYEFRNNGDADFTNGTYDIQLPVWLQAINSSVSYTGFPTDPTIVSSSNLMFDLPTLAFGTNTYKICFQAVVQAGAIGGPNSFWSVASGGNLINPDYVCYTAFNICAFAAIGIDKFVKGDLDGVYTTNGSGTPNSTVQYKITIHNTGTIPADSLEVIDRIPRQGNMTILGNPTNSVLIQNDVAMEMLPATATSDYTIAYTDDQNICLPNPPWFATGTPCTTGSWGGSVSSSTKGVKFTFNPAFILYPGDSYDIYFSTHLPDTAVNGMVDCNTAGFIGKSTIGGYIINPVEINPPVCITVVDDTCNFLCNSDFEDNQVVGAGEQGFFDPELIPCWNTTEDFIEVWGDDFQNVPSYTGNQFIELNAHTVGTLYQDFTITPGSTTTISFAHRGRVGFANDMSVAIEPAPLGSGTQVILGTFSAVTTAWTLNSVSYTFPNDNVTAYVLSFISLPVGGSSAGGNFLDAITIACPSAICGVKFNDLNGDGVWDTDEPGLENWTISLSGTLTLTTSTDSYGNFCFSDLPAGTYTVSEVNQVNWEQTEPVSPGTYTVTTISGQTIDTVRFGNHFVSQDTCNNIDVKISPVDGGDCCYLIEVSNTFQEDYFSGISISSDNLSISSVSNDNDWSSISYQTPNQVDFTEISKNSGLPLDTAGFQTLGNICFTGSGINHLTVSFITGDAPELEMVCVRVLEHEGCSIAVDTSCVSVLDIAASCLDGNPVMEFSIQNNSSFTIRGITLYSQNTDIIAYPRFIPIPDLLPGQSSATIETTLLISDDATNGCFFISACDQNTEPGINGQYPQFCCMDSILYCVEIPTCNPCNALTITATENDPDACCYNLTLQNNYYNENVAFIEFTGIEGTQFAFLSGWSIIPPVSTSHIKIKAPEGGISRGNYPDFASFCLTGTSTAPHVVLVSIIDVMGNVLCIDTLSFDCQLVEPSCANIVSDSLYCSGDQIKYTFYVKNNAPFPLYQVDFHMADNSIVLDSTFVEPHPPIGPGETGGPFTVAILSADADLENFCIYLTGHNGIYDPELGLAATACCTDSLAMVCLPMIACNTPCDTISCCQFGNMTIPNGITPNNDGINDVFEILNTSCCQYIAIKVFNRWGNMVYQSDDYQNDWKGDNQDGTKLVQGTYFIILTLPTGNERASYIDVRY